MWQFSILSLIVGLAQGQSVFKSERDFFDNSRKALTTADGENQPESVNLFQAPENVYHHNAIEKQKREITLRQLIEIDFGPNVSRVLTHIRQKSGYDKRIRPNYYGKPVRVGVSMFISGISHISEVNQDVTVDFYFRQYWQDHRLSFAGIWNEELVLGGEFMHEIWRPDTFFVNAKLSSFHQVTQLNTFIRVSPSGSITQSLRLTVTSSCPMDFKNFPLDSQKCSLEIESFGYTTKDINYTWANVGKPSVSFAPEVHKLPQFRICGHREALKVERLSTGNYSRLTLTLYLERSLGYYVIQVYLPSALIVCLSQISFWLSRESPPARVSLGITTVLTMTTVISSTNAQLPKISYLKAIDIYLVFCFFMVFSALIEYAAVTYTGKRCKMRIARRAAKKAAYEKLKSTKQSSADEDDDSDVGGCMSETCKYCQHVFSKASDIEKYSRIVFPTVFLSFNIFYWISYLNVAHVPVTEEGFLAAE